MALLIQTSYGLSLLVMRTIITVFKPELQSKKPVLDRIIVMTREFIEMGEAYTFSPRPGKLFDLLNLLRMNNVNYETNFSIDDEPLRS